MNNDLISRDALKQAMRKAKRGHYAAFSDVTLQDIYRVIDNAPTIKDRSLEIAQKSIELGRKVGQLEGKLERPQGEIVIKCQDCKYQVKEWREDKRMKEKGYWVYGCNHFGDIMGYWGFGGNDNEFCSDAERKGGAE